MSFDVEKNVNAVTLWLQDYLKKTGAKGFVLGISGGKDSAVVAALLVRAVGKEKVFGVMMPNGTQGDILDSENVIKDLGIDSKVVNIKEAYDGIVNAISDLKNRESFINICPRLRMTTLYAIASEKNYLVCGTGNRSECYIGYFTKWGDGASDLNPIGNFTTEEVVAIGDFIGATKSVVHKIPSDGLSGCSDEEKIGFSYKDLNKYIETGVADEKIKSIIDTRHNNNQHKLNPIPVFQKNLK